MAWEPAWDRVCVRMRLYLLRPLAIVAGIRNFSFSSVLRIMAWGGVDAVSGIVYV